MAKQVWKPVQVDVPAYRQWYDQNIRNSWFIFEDNEPCEILVGYEDETVDRVYIRQVSQAAEAWIPREFVKQG